MKINIDKHLNEIMEFITKGPDLGIDEVLEWMPGYIVAPYYTDYHTEGFLGVGLSITSSVPMFIAIGQKTSRLYLFSVVRILKEMGLDKGNDETQDNIISGR